MYNTSCTIQSIIFAEGLWKPEATSRKSVPGNDRGTSGYK